jgi:hypothetical protein
MKQLKIFGRGTQSRSSNATVQNLINMYLEQGEDGTVAYGTAGLSSYVTLGDTPIRGMYSIDDNNIYLVHKSTFYGINSAGVATAYGTLLSSAGRVDMSHNTTQIIVVDGSTTGYIFTIGSGAFAAIADPDFPGADTVAFNNGKFIVNKPNTGQYWISQSYNGASWVATDFATAESSPDNLIRVAVDHGELILFGDRTTEFAVDTGGLDFPYTRVQGATAEWGLAARWSVAKFNNSLIWLAKNRMGEVQVVTLQGYQLQRVSTSDIENIINGYTTVTDATGFSYMYNGHPFYQINFTSAGESWLYDGLSDRWTKKMYGNSGRDLAEIAITKTSDVYVSGYSYGNLYRVNPNAYTDNGTTIVSEITTTHAKNGLDRLPISAIQVDCETGIGNSDVANPQIMLQVSKDNGHTWKPERQTSLGAIGNYNARAIFRRLGISRDWAFKIRITDPVKRVITGLWLS